MKIKDIKGKDFTAIVFVSDNQLMYTNSYNEILGQTGKILATHPTYPQYTNIEFKNGVRLHFPTKVVIEQVERNEPVEDIFTVLARIERLTR